MSKYPEHDKLAGVRDQSQVIGEFLEEFLPSQGIVLCENKEYYDEYLPARKKTNELLAKFFGVDLDKLELEKRAMLDKLMEEASKNL